ncbi:MAG TPA: hypothetical protein VFK57_05550 [Vicinamibacterales bacterium]|nr:hypothetical protein [Vicinamibacterales bacterium]
MRRAAAALCVLAACSKAPSAPSSPATPPPAVVAYADFSGYWSGTFAYKACAGLHCSGRIDRDDPFSLRLRQTLNHVVGVFASQYGGSLEVAGDVQPDGSLSLAGSEATGGTSGARGSVTFAAPSLRLDPATGLRGAMRFERTTLLSSLDKYVSQGDGSIVSARRQSLDAFVADLGGTWKGFYLVRDCVDETGRPLCGLFNSPGYVEYIELTLSVGANEAAGELIPVSTRIPVAGAARARSIELTGGRDELGGRIADRVTALSASVDDFGRLRGGFSYLRIFDGRTSTARVDFVQVVKVP